MQATNLAAALITKREDGALVSEFERQSVLWQKIAAHLEGRLALLRKKNDNAEHDAIETAKLRGQIGEVKNLLALAQPAPAMEAEHDKA